MFSPPNEFDNQFFLKLIALTACVHIGLLGTLFFCESWFARAPLPFSIKGPASPVSLISGRQRASHGRAVGTPDGMGTKKTAQSSVTPATAMPPAVQSPTVSSPATPEVNKKEVVAEPQLKPVQAPEANKSKKSAESKKEVQKKEPLKKEAQKKETSKKDAIKQETKKNESLKKENDKKSASQKSAKSEKATKQDSKKAQPKEETKKAKSATKKDAGIKSAAQTTSQKTELQSKTSKAVPLIESKLTTNVLSRAAGNNSENVELPQQAMHGEAGGTVEFDVGNGAVSADAVVQEFANHFTLPPGFDDTEPFTVSFEIHEGKVTHISPHGRESLVVYTAVKDALLRSTMPRGRDRKITLLIT